MWLCVCKSDSTVCCVWAVWVQTTAKFNNSFMRHFSLTPYHFNKLYFKFNIIMSVYWRMYVHENSTVCCIIQYFFVTLLSDQLCSVEDGTPFWPCCTWRTRACWNTVQFFSSIIYSLSLCDHFPRSCFVAFQAKDILTCHCLFKCVCV